MELKEVKGVTFVDGGVCASKGFRANGIQCGPAHKPLTSTDENSAVANNALPVKKKNDLALIVADKECTAAAVYTTNKVKGAPILVTKEHTKTVLQRRLL